MHVPQWFREFWRSKQRPPQFVIVSFDGHPVDGSQALGTLIHGQSPGDSVSVGVVRPDGAHDTVTVKLGTNPLP